PATRAGRKEVGIWQNHGSGSDDNAVSCALSHGPLSHETPPAGHGGRHWPKSENQPRAKLIAAKRLAIKGFLRRLSLPASTLTSFDAARWLLPCRGHV